VGSYDGGKGGAGIAQWIINQIPPHTVYIEAFLGDGRVLRAKRPAARSIGIEVDAQVLAKRWRGDELPGLNLVCLDALRFLQRYRWKGGEFLYLDPPYPMIVRSWQQPVYAHEFAAIEQHRELLTLLRRLPCPVAISSYWSWLYELELAGWRMSSFQTIKRSGEIATECLWMNYPEPTDLHDYRYLGSDFRQRQHIKRKKERWVARLRNMPALERHALLAAIEELRGETHNDASVPGAIVIPDDAADGYLSIVENGDAPATYNEPPAGD